MRTAQGKTLLNTNRVEVYLQTTLMSHVFFYNHVVVEFKIYIFFPFWFQTSTLPVLKRLSILEQQTEGGTPKPSISKLQVER